MIQNPVLTGFHADPSMICVDGTFYVANSTFEYFPGVRISASKDLANWECVAIPLDRSDYLNMRGNPESGGIFAPALSYHNGLFYLIFTDVKYWKGAPFKDTHNYITAARDIKGPWSEPVYINSSGFDPSLFHDDDGRKYFVNMEWDFRKPNPDTFSGILVTELDPVTLKPISEPVKVFKGSEHKWVEGPHIYKKDGWYYMIVAEGGTFYSHAATVARSKDIYGPYEMHPNTFLVTTKDAPDSPIQKCGHASWCQGPDGRWFTAFLCSRPYYNKRCVLGRETSINEMVWGEDGWPYLKNGTVVPDFEFEGYGEKHEKKFFDYTFGTDEFYREFNSLRGPAKHQVGPDNVLRIYGGESLYSNQRQNMFVRRQMHMNFQATTSLVNPNKHFKKFGGLLYRYDELSQYLLKVAYDEEKDCQTIAIMAFKQRDYEYPLDGKEIEIPKDIKKVWLRVTAHKETARFSYSFDGKNFTEIDYDIDTTVLSDDYNTGFTGAFVGMYASDLEYNESSFVDFHSFTYEVLD